MQLHLARALASAPVGALTAA